MGPGRCEDGTPNKQYMNYFHHRLEDNPPLLEDHRVENISAPAISRYVNILMDKWFRKIFSAEANKEALLGILRELIPEREISDIFYNKEKKRKKSPFIDGHDAVFDVECVDIQGARFVVEMQVEEQLHFLERALFYSTFPIQEQVRAQKKGRPRRTHDEQFNFAPVYLISFLDFSLHQDSDKILYRYNLREEESGELMTDRINYIFLEMANYRRVEPRLEDGFAEKLSYMFRNMYWLTERPSALAEKVFGLIFDACEVSLLNEQEQQEYENDIMTTELDRRNILYTREFRGYERGLEEGGEKRAVKIARRMLDMGMEISVIAIATDLSEEEIRGL